MANPRTSPEIWDDDEVEPPLHYPNATRRRALIAHSLGVVGVLGTLALGAVAIVPHLSWLTHRAHNLFAPEPPAEELAPPVPVAAAPVKPPVTVEHAASAHVEAAVPAPLPSSVTPPQTPSAVAPAAATDTAAPSAAASAPAPVDTTTQAASAEPVTPPAPVAAPTAEKPASRAVSSGRRRTEPRLTWAEIERRKARYEAWLKSQGLEPVH
jgi:hypothetical protein